MPQEIEVWYILPALRKELAKIFVTEYKLSQKETAQMLGLTESAISQYLNEKRATEVSFSQEDLAKIKETAKKIVRDKEQVLKYLYDISTKFRGSQVICDIHRKHDKSLPEDCKVCMEIQKKHNSVR